MIASKLTNRAVLPEHSAWFFSQWRAFKAAEAPQTDLRFPPAKTSERVTSLWDETATTAFDAQRYGCGCFVLRKRA